MIVSCNIWLASEFKFHKKKQKGFREKDVFENQMNRYLRIVLKFIEFKIRSIQDIRKELVS